MEKLSEHDKYYVERIYAVIEPRGNMNHACLLVDVYCYTCKKLMALSNAKQHDGRYYCLHCIQPFEVDINVGGEYKPELDIHWDEPR